MRTRLAVLTVACTATVALGASTAIGATLDLRDRPVGNGGAGSVGNGGNGGVGGVANGGNGGNGGVGNGGNGGGGNGGNGGVGNGGNGGGGADSVGNGNDANGGAANGNGGNGNRPTGNDNGNAAAAGSAQDAERPGQKPASKPTRPAKPAGGGTAATAGEPRTYPTIVVFRASVDGVGALANAQAERTTGRAPKHVFTKTIRGWAGDLSLAERRALEADPNVAFVSPDRPVQATATVRQSAEAAPTGIQRVGGPSPLTAFPAVAVVDTGIAKHPDLAIRGGVNCVGGSPKAWTDQNGHGTHVAGTIAARADGAGVIGVAPGAPLWAVRVLDRSGSGSWSSVICGLDYVARNAGAIKVANLSLSGGGTDGGNCGAATGDALHRAICGAVAAGVTVVVAAGNSSANVAGSVPAAYDEVITVSALGDYDGTPGGGAGPTCADYGADDTFASFSNHATSDADRAHMLAAPGACIRSTWLKNGFATISGTSMASPHVAGAAAAYIAANPGVTPGAVRAALRAGAEPLGAGHLDPRGLNPEPLLLRP